MDEIKSFVIIFIVAAVPFLLLREFFCWYWKINEIKDLLKKINENLQNMRSLEVSSISEQKKKKPAVLDERKKDGSKKMGYGDDVSDDELDKFIQFLSITNLEVENE